MRQRVCNQIDNVPIRKRIVDVVAIAPPGNQALAAKYSQPLRHGGELIVHRRDDLGHAALAILEKFQNAQPRRIAHRAKQLGGTIKRRGRNRQRNVNVIGRLTGCG